MRAMYSLTFFAAIGAFAGFRALGHLDFEFFGVNKIIGVTPKRPEATCLILLAAAGSKR